MNTEADKTIWSSSGMHQNWVICFDEAIQVECDGLGNVMQLLEVVSVPSNERRQCNGGNIADGSLIR